METRSLVTDLDGGPAVELDQARLVVARGPDQGRERTLGDGPLVVGRGEGADWRLRDDTISREHLRIQPCEGGWQVVDLGSKSGTTLDGTRVEAAPLVDGCLLGLGSSELRFHRARTRLPAPAPEAAEFHGMVGASEPMRRLFGLLERVAPLELTVHLHGESGTGKELLARAVHDLSQAARGPYEVVDCTLVSPEHLRSELFGHIKGAYTGATADRDGAFVRAHGGTLFLDEVGELPLDLQPALLRAIELGEVRPLGADSSRRTRVRIVSATHRDLPAMVERGEFRQDLYYRLAAFVLEVPPLRERGEDVLRLATRLLPEGYRLSPQAETRLLEHAWPGNVRELANVLAAAPALADGPVLGPSALNLRRGVDPGDVRLEDAEVTTIRRALEQAGGNRTLAAERLGIARSTLYEKIKKYGL